MSDPKESPTALDVDSLPPTEYLALEALAARHRLGEQSWTFPAQPRIVAAVHALARRGLVDVKSGVAPKTILAWLTDAGRSAALRDGYEPPILRMIEASSLGTAEAKALRASVPDEVAAAIVARSKEFAERSDLPVGQQSKLSWPEAIARSLASFEEIERRRIESAEREAALTPSCCAEDELATELAEERMLHQQTIAERDALLAEVARVRADVAEDLAAIFSKRAQDERAQPGNWALANDWDVAAQECEDYATRAAEGVVAAPPAGAPPADFVATFRAAYRAAYDGVAGLAHEMAGKGFPSSPAALPDVVGTPERPAAREALRDMLAEVLHRQHCAAGKGDECHGPTQRETFDAAAVVAWFPDVSVDGPAPFRFLLRSAPVAREDAE